MDLLRNHHYLRRKYGLSSLPTAETFAFQLRHELMAFLSGARGEYDKAFLESIQKHGQRLLKRGLIKEDETGRLLEAPVVPKDLCLSNEDVADGVTLWVGASGSLAYPLKYG
eukprot:4221797-Lingulodinium_polyedra.AAC.1